MRSKLEKFKEKAWQKITRSGRKSHENLICLGHFSFAQKIMIENNWNEAWRGVGSKRRKSKANEIRRRRKAESFWKRKGRRAQSFWWIALWKKGLLQQAFKKYFFLRISGGVHLETEMHQNPTFWWKTVGGFVYTRGRYENLQSILSGYMRGRSLESSKTCIHGSFILGFSEFS